MGEWFWGLIEDIVLFDLGFFLGRLDYFYGEIFSDFVRGKRRCESEKRRKKD